MSDDRMDEAIRELLKARAAWVAYSVLKDEIELSSSVIAAYFEDLGGTILESNESYPSERIYALGSAVPIEIMPVGSPRVSVTVPLSQFLALLPAIRTLVACEEPR